jgi:hypothetical protein
MANKGDRTKPNIVQYLNWNGHTAWQQQTVGVKGRKLPPESIGIGDICACLRPSGQHLEVELKREGDRVREGQVRHANLIRRSGGLHIIVEDFDDFVTQFHSLRR